MRQGGVLLEVGGEDEEELMDGWTCLAKEPEHFVGLVVDL